MSEWSEYCVGNSVREAALLVRKRLEHLGQYGQRKKSIVHNITKPRRKSVNTSQPSHTRILCIYI